jgi:hypothetical protein
LVSGFDGQGIAWSETRGRARMLAARSVHDARNIPIGEALKGLRVLRAPEHDDLAGHFSDQVIDLEHIAWYRRET